MTAPDAIFRVLRPRGKIASHAEFSAPINGFGGYWLRSLLASTLSFLCAIQMHQCRIWRHAIRSAFYLIRTLFLDDVIVPERILTSLHVIISQILTLVHVCIGVLYTETSDDILSDFISNKNFVFLFYAPVQDRTYRFEERQADKERNRQIDGGKQADRQSHIIQYILENSMSYIARILVNSIFFHKASTEE